MSVYTKTNFSKEGIKPGKDKLVGDYDKFSKAVTSSVAKAEDITDKKIKYIGNRRSKAAQLRQLRRDDPSGYQIQKNEIARVHEDLIAEHAISAELFWKDIVGLKPKEVETAVENEIQIIETIYDVRFKAVFNTEPFQDGKHVDVAVE